MENSVSATELHELLAARERGEADFVLVDVREGYEFQIVSIDCAALVPLGQILSDAAREVLPPQEKVVLYCHHDGRSAYAANTLSANGWEDVSFVRGGIDAWVAEVEPHKARY